MENSSERIVPCIIYLAGQNDAFREKSCTICTEQNGKFLKLIEMIASFDNPMAERLRNIKINISISIIWDPGCKLN